MTVVALLAGCLDSPPAAVDSKADAAADRDGAPACAGLDLLVESFEEADPMAEFLALWDPGEAQVMVGGGAVTLTADNGESLINSVVAYEPTGKVRYEALELTAGAIANLTLYDETVGTTRIAISDATLDLYAPPDEFKEIERDASFGYYSLGFAGDQIELAASADGEAWTVLQTWLQPYLGPVRVAIAVEDPDGVSDLVVQGVNTPATGLDCP